MLSLFFAHDKILLKHVRSQNCEFAAPNGEKCLAANKNSPFWWQYCTILLDGADLSIVGLCHRRRHRRGVWAMMRPLRPLAAFIPMRQPPPWVLRVGLQGTPGWCKGALLCQRGTRWAVQLHKAWWGWCLPCENIPTWISLCVTTVFSQQGGISVLISPRGFRSSLGQRAHFIRCIGFNQPLSFLSHLYQPSIESFAMLVFEAQPAILTFYQHQRL